MKRILVIAPREERPTCRDCLSAHAGLSIEETCWDRIDTVDPGLSLLVAVIEESAPNPAESLRRAAAHAPDCPCLAVLPCGASPELIQAAARFASDFVLLPLRPDELRLRVGRFLAEARDEVSTAKQRLAEEACLRQFVTGDPKFLSVLEDVRKLARANAPVLIAGETGTGKELCARALHHLGPRRDGPFIPVDCDALPDHLF